MEHVKTNKPIWESSIDLLSGVNGEEYFEENSQCQLVNTKDIQFNKLCQARSGLNHKQVSSYTKAMENEHKFPPIRLAWIDNGNCLTVIDGWHRLEAVKEIGVNVIPAIVERMTLNEAMGKAAIANLGHGLPLKKSELRNVFKLFIQSKSNRKKNNQLMSYREISKAFNGCVGHTTIANWMKKDFPKIARAMGGIEHGNFKAEPPRVDVQLHYYKEVSEGLDYTLANYKELSSPESRYEVYQQALEMVSKMEEYPMRKPDF